MVVSVVKISLRYQYVCVEEDISVEDVKTPHVHRVVLMAESVWLLADVVAEPVTKANCAVKLSVTHLAKTVGSVLGLICASVVPIIREKIVANHYVSVVVTMVANVLRQTSVPVLLVTPEETVAGRFVPRVAKMAAFVFTQTGAGVSREVMDFSAKSSAANHRVQSNVNVCRGIFAFAKETHHPVKNLNNYLDANTVVSTAEDVMGKNVVVLLLTVVNGANEDNVLMKKYSCHSPEATDVR